MAWRRVAVSTKALSHLVNFAIEFASTSDTSGCTDTRLLIGDRRLLSKARWFRIYTNGHTLASWHHAAVDVVDDDREVNSARAHSADLVNGRQKAT